VEVSSKLLIFAFEKLEKHWQYYSGCNDILASHNLEASNHCHPVVGM